MTGIALIDDGAGGGSVPDVRQKLNEVIAAVNAAIGSAMRIVGSLDCAGFPDYPSASSGDTFVASSPGTVGGPEGKATHAGDLVLCCADSPGGSEEQTGSRWIVVGHNLFNLGTSAAMDVDQDEDFGEGSPSTVPSQRAVSAFVAKQIAAVISSLRLGEASQMPVASAEDMATLSDSALPTMRTVAMFVETLIADLSLASAAMAEISDDEEMATKESAVPSRRAVAAHVASRISELGLGAAATRGVSNDVTEGDGEEVVPTQRAVKTYVDDKVSGIGGAVFLIGEVVTSGSASHVSFDDIPQDFRDLEVRVTGRSQDAANSDDLLVIFNDDEGSNYDYEDTISPAPGNISLAANCAVVGHLIAARTGADYADTTSISLPNYSGEVFFKGVVANGQVRVGNAAHATRAVAWWKSTAPIDRVKLSLAGGPFSNGTVVSLYGRK